MQIHIHLQYRFIFCIDICHLELFPEPRLYDEGLCKEGAVVNIMSVMVEPSASQEVVPELGEHILTGAVLVSGSDLS